MPSISPHLQKGAIITFDPNTGVKLATIMLQYNPDSLTRSLKPQTVGDEPDRTEILRLKGPPIETLKCDLEIDATDQLAAADPIATNLGIQPQLALLELLLIPQALCSTPTRFSPCLGRLKILPMETALTVFAWSKSRVTPIRITDLSITEEAFDVNLNPIRAKVSLGMRVLNVNDVGFQSPAGAMYMIYQTTKEALAQQA